MRTAPGLLALAIASALSFPLHAETPADADGTRTLDPAEIKAGYFIDMLVQPWWQDNEHGKRINASLRAVRLRREGPLIAEGGISKDAAISSFDDDDEGGFGGDTGSDDDMGGL